MFWIDGMNPPGDPKLSGSNLCVRRQSPTLVPGFVYGKAILEIFCTPYLSKRPQHAHKNRCTGRSCPSEQEADSRAASRVARVTRSIDHASAWPPFRARLADS